MIHRSGRREIGFPQLGEDATEASVCLTGAEAVALAGLLTGARVYLTPEAAHDPGAARRVKDEPMRHDLGPLR